VCIDAVGFRYTKGRTFSIIYFKRNNLIISLFIIGLLHTLQRAVYLETDTPEILSEAITIVRKGGTVSVIGD
jgi:hypothetical protein